MNEDILSILLRIEHLRAKIELLEQRAITPLELRPSHWREDSQLSLRIAREDLASEQEELTYHLRKGVHAARSSSPRQRESFLWPYLRLDAYSPAFASW